MDIPIAPITWVLNLNHMLLPTRSYMNHLNDRDASSTNMSVSSLQSPSAPSRCPVQCDTEKRSTVYWASLNNANSPRTTSLRVPRGSTAGGFPHPHGLGSLGVATRADRMLRMRMRGPTGSVPKSNPCPWFTNPGSQWIAMPCKQHAAMQKSQPHVRHHQ